METKQQPATPLPWKDGPVFQNEGRALFFTDASKPGTWQRRIDDKAGVFDQQDADYLVRAANMYPKLVAALKLTLPLLMENGNAYRTLIGILRELGEQ